jgi:signal transduction histidine kinase
MPELVIADSPAVPSPTGPQDPPDRPGPESPAFAALRARVADALLERAAEIAARWEHQSRTVALREPGEVPRAAQTSVATALVRSLAGVLASDGATSEELVPIGLGVGADAFELASSMHHALKGIDLLSAMTLFAVESAVAGESDATAADGVRLSRRIQQAVSLLMLAAAKGYSQAMSDAMRDRFRHLRHDLRNPLGTIKSVLAMMDDETMPAETRAHPRFRTMAKRNARSLGDLIAERLSDTAAVFPVLTHQSVSLRTIACAVRRELRAEADARGVRVVVSDDRVHVAVDAVGLELLLHELLHAALQEAEAGSELRIELVHDARDKRAGMTILPVPERPPIQEPRALERLLTLTPRMGGAFAANAREATLSMPVQIEEEEAPEAAARPGMDVPTTLPLATAADAPVPGLPSAGEAGHDLRGTGEREHGQPRAL